MKNDSPLYSLFLQHPTICTDSRNVKSNSLFFALQGKNFNGNIFAKQALNDGAAFAIIDEMQHPQNERFILVNDVLETLQQLAHEHRNKLKCKIIGITGSNGKTTTKELIKVIIEKKYKTSATVGNLNNHIGVPLTLLSLTDDVQMAVIEMGANHKKEIAALCEIANPDYGIITNVGKAHLGEFGGFEGVKQAKGELYDFLKTHNSIAFVNGNNQYLAEMSAKLNNKITYGTTEENNCIGKLIDAEKLGVGSWKLGEDNQFQSPNSKLLTPHYSPFLQLQWKASNSSWSEIINTNLVGKYNFENILAAVCIGNYFGVESQEIKDAIEHYKPDNNRSQILKVGTSTILLDAYNANPTSMEAAIANFNETEAERKIVIFGDMMELGEETDKEHQQIVEMLGKCQFAQVILIGEYFGRFKNFIDCEYFQNTEDTGKWLQNQHFQNTHFLIKGSRKMKLERIVDYLGG